MNRDFNKKRPSAAGRSEDSSNNRPYNKRGSAPGRTNENSFSNSARGSRSEKREFNQDDRRVKPTSGREWKPSDKEGKVSRTSYNNENNSHASINNAYGNRNNRFSNDKPASGYQGGSGFNGKERGERPYKKDFESGRTEGRNFTRPTGRDAAKPFNKFNSDKPNREGGARRPGSEQPYKKEYNRTEGWKPAGTKPQRFGKDVESGEVNFNRPNREHKSADDHFGHKEFSRRGTSFRSRETGNSRSQFSNSPDRFDKPKFERKTGTGRFGAEGEKPFKKERPEGASSFRKERNDGTSSFRNERSSSTSSFRKERNDGFSDFKKEGENRRPARAPFKKKVEPVSEAPDYDFRKFNEFSRKKEKGAGSEAAGKKSEEIRLNRFISNAGVCSRRDADELIQQGRIKVNGKVVTEMGYKVTANDEVKLDGKALNREKLVYVLLNKPKDHITTTDDPDERKTVMDLVKTACTERIYPVGRLDRNTTGLLLLTNDGELAEKLAHPANNIKKIYQVELDKPILEVDIEKIKEGLELEDGLAKVDAIEVLTPDALTLGVEIHIGKNRIVRRLFEHVGYTVVKLDRVLYAGLTKKDLPRGKWRYLSEKEVVQLKFKK
jgi:23S rRNA pseudouridine2605 synthase